MKKEIKEILNKCREILCSLIKRLHKGMMSILKFINVFDIIPIEISARFFIHTNKNYSKIYVERQCLSRTVEIVLKKIRTMIKEFESAGASCVVVDAPTLIESGFHKECDLVVAVLCASDTRISRAAVRDNISEEKARARIFAQHDDLFYTSVADYVVINDGNEKQLADHARILCDKISRL